MITAEQKEQIAALGLSYETLEALARESKQEAEARKKRDGVKIRRELEQHCRETYGMKLSDIFTATEKPLRIYANTDVDSPDFGKQWHSKGKKPAWLKGREKDFLQN